MRAQEGRSDKPVREGEGRRTSCEEAVFAQDGDGVD